MGKKALITGITGQEPLSDDTYSGYGETAVRVVLLEGIEK